MADDEDRSGKADTNTAKNFLASFQFMEVLSQFGDLAPEIQEKRKYAKWKAANITSSLKKGLVPKPGAPKEDVDEPPLDNLTESNSNNTVPPFPDIQNNSSFPNTSSIPNVPSFSDTPPNYNYSASNTINNSSSSYIPSFPNASTFTQPTDPVIKPVIKLVGAIPTPFTSEFSSALPSVQTLSTKNGYQPSDKDIELANKYAKFVVSSLQFEDIPAAIKNLKLCLKSLTGSETGM